MSNLPRAKGLPAAFSATGQDVPPSPEVAFAAMADGIGMATALHLAQVLGPLLEQVAKGSRRPMCIVCSAKAKRAERAWEKDAAIRLQAAEEPPGPPDVKLTESFTDGSRGPVCWACYDPDVDGPFDLADCLPPAED